MLNLRKTINSIVYGNRLVALIRIMMGMMFIFSGIFKVYDPHSFSRVILMYNILPEIIVPYFAIVLPHVELMIGVLLIIGFKIKSSTLLSIIIMTIFTIAITINVIRGESFDCGCFELSRFGINEDISVKLIFRDIFIIAIFIIIFNAKKHFYSLDNVFEEDELTHL